MDANKKTLNVLRTKNKENKALLTDGTEQKRITAVAEEPVESATADDATPAVAEPTEEAA